MKKSSNELKLEKLEKITEKINLMVVPCLIMVFSFGILGIVLTSITLLYIGLGFSVTGVILGICLMILKDKKNTLKS